jgi:hypothetical protein
MRALPNDLRRQLETAVLDGRRAAETGVRAAFATLGVKDREKPAHLSEGQARLRRGLRAKQRQLGGEYDVLVWDAAYEQWHRLLFACFLAENNLLRHPEFNAPVTLAECEELAAELGEPDGWSVAARFAAEILPGIFRLDDPCVQLRLAPEHRIALERIVAGLPAEVFAADDSLGWVYQYWQSERKDQVNASEVKIGGASLGPVTQLFTENYMVRFLLENSLGAWWAARYPDSPLVRNFEYLRFDDDGQPAAGRFEGWPERVAGVTVMDPCCGSGHFLVEAFGMLWRMRAEEEGLDTIAAQDAVLRDNLYGLELDPRCVQIAMFAVALTAWKQGGGWRELPTPNIACSGIPAKAPLEEWIALAGGDERLERALERLHTLFKDADTLGSLIDPRRAAESAGGAPTQRSFDDVDYAEVVPLLHEAAKRETDDPATAVLGADAAGIARSAVLLSNSYTLVATNYPYLGFNRFGPPLKSMAGDSSARYDLATLFCELVDANGWQAVAVPESWTNISRFQALRRSWLSHRGIRLHAPLGSGAFSEITGEVVRPTLDVFSATSYSNVAFLTDVSESPGSAKSQGLLSSRIHNHEKATVARNPGYLMTPPLLIGNRLPLEQVADCLAGLFTGDGNQFERNFWEVDLDTRWMRLQTAASAKAAYSGRNTVILWEHERGRLAALAESVRHLNHAAQNWRRGKPHWGKAGIAVNTVGELACTPYLGDAYAASCAAIIPHDSEDIGALWAFGASGQLESTIRSYNKRLSISPGVILQCPIELDRWRRVAAEKYPNGLPEPWSDDPTQWLFEGRPAEATEPLQGAVGRLVSYRWPEQSDSDELDELADDDGIVCLPAVGGELPAANRLPTLLARAYGDKWSPGLLRQLLEQTGSKKKNLAEWLRDDFFSHHCSVFSNRPFVWHIWDGRKDGFAALVNYHRLDRAGLERLTYTYLGDWIERQRADAADEVAGADLRLAAAQQLKRNLEAILEGEPPYDIYVRWKALHEQPIGWEPDLDDGVRLNIRPFVKAGVLRSKVNVHWRKDRGKNPDGSERINDLHYRVAEKREARQKVMA